MMPQDGFVRDPVQGLQDFVQDIKPYHVKVIEVLVEYIYHDDINITINDSIQSHEQININKIVFGCPDGFATGPFDFLAGNLDPETDITAVDQFTQSFTLDISQGDITDRFPTGKVVLVTQSTANDGFYTVDSSIFNGSETVVTVVEFIPDATVDGKLSPYVEDSLNLPISNFDVTISDCTPFNASGNTLAATTFTEQLLFDILVTDDLGGPYDDIFGFDPLGTGFDF